MIVLLLFGARLRDQVKVVLEISEVFGSWALRTVWPSGLRRWLKAPVRKGVGSNPTAVISQC